MKRVNPDKFRRDIATNLSLFERVLSEEVSDIVINTDPIKSAASTAARSSKKAEWRYELTDLRMRVPLPKQAIPSGCIGPVEIIIDVDLQGVCGEDGTDCITHLGYNLHISASNGQFLCAWHFDRHIGEPDDGDEAHPLYHFQHGGHKMKPHENALGQALLLPAPRLASPPMDAILFVDFILSNFEGKAWRKLRANASYVRLVQESQARHWKPFVGRLAKWWEIGPKDEAARELWPHLA